MSMEMRRRTMREKQKEMEKEWGTQVRGKAPLEELAELEAGPIIDDETTETDEEEAMERAREEAMDDETYAEFKKQ
jgi:16S rRNA U516 pseudouridylate synthase RsuA-like enzyme